MSKKLAPRNQPQVIAGGAVKRGDGGLAKQEARTDAAVISIRNDGWGNVLSGARTNKDQRSFTRYSQPLPLRPVELEGMYQGDTLMRRIVDKLPNLITRDPWKIKGDTDRKVFKYLVKLKFMQAVRKALKWARLFGGGIVVMGIDDGRTLDRPLNVNAVRTIEFFRVYDRYSVTGNTLDWNQDPESPRYGLREWYTIYPRGSVLPTQQFRVHWTRVLQFDGPETTDIQKARNYGWNDSLVQIVYDDVRRFMSGLDDASLLIRDFVQGVLQVTDLTNILTGSKAAIEKWRQRLDAMDMTRHSLNTMLLDKEEQYTKVSSSVAGISDIIQRLMDQVCVAADMPATVLFGKSPSGLNASGESEMRIWYDGCTADQRETLAPAVELVTAIVVQCKDYDGPKLTDIEVQFAPLFKPTMKEEAEMRYSMAQSDQIYINTGVLSEDEVAVSRFGGDDYSLETELVFPRDPAKPPEPEPEPAPATGNKPPPKK